MSYIAVFLVISFLVFFHELGHFLVAKLLGVKVEVFSIGFGKKLISKTYKGTTYCYSLIPLGGYVQLKGQDDSDPTKINTDFDSYSSKTPYERILILFAGPFFNFILAFFLYLAVANLGYEKLSPEIGKVLENSAAQKANLKENDIIKSINGIEIENWDEISKLVGLEPLNLGVQRDSKIHYITLVPKVGTSQNIFGEVIEKPLIGISPSGKTVTLYKKGLDGLNYAYNETKEAMGLIFTSLEKIVSGIVSPKELGGPISIVKFTNDAANMGLSVLFLFTALISVNLGVLNLFPIPALDGGHILFNLYEIIFRRPINEKAFVGLTYAGWLFLLSLMVFTTFNDILRFS